MTGSKPATSAAMKTWLITGASRGLGRQLALQLAARGDEVLAVARDTARLQALADEVHADGRGRVLPLPLDLSDSSALHARISAATAALPRLDGVVNNAGIGAYKPLLAHDPAELMLVIQVNLTAAMLVCHAVLPRLLAQGHGHIVNIGSDLARRPLAQMAAYVASKHGLAGFTHSLLREVRSRGVKVSLVNPGIIDTGFGGGVEGSGDAHGSLPPEALAAVVLQLLDQPGSVTVDELSVHPLGQADF
jgi:short-subunit dehydrogenase